MWTRSHRHATECVLCPCVLEKVCISSLIIPLYCICWATGLTFRFLTNIFLLLFLPLPFGFTSSGNLLDPPALLLIFFFNFGLPVFNMQVFVLVFFCFVLFWFLSLFNYSCLPFLPIPPPHPSRTHLPPLPPSSPLILSVCPL